MGNSTKGTLFLIPALLSNSDPEDVIPANILDKIRPLKLFITENAKSARAWMKLIGMEHPFSEITVLEIDKHSKHQEINYFFEGLLNGVDTGLMSEAGMPGIADPGAEFVRHAHKQNIKVVPFTGPSSIFLALAASGLNGQGFSFNGYLPKDKTEKQKKIQFYENLAKKNLQTQIFIETPYRNQQLFDDLLRCCNGNTLLCIATNITGSDEFIQTHSIDKWKNMTVNINKKPTVFLFL